MWGSGWSPHILWSFGLRRIDRLVLTHAHHDHMAGLRTVINNFPVEELWIGKNPLIPEYVDLLKAALRKGVFIRTFCQGETAQFANGTFEFLNPEPNAVIGPTPKNNDSLAFRLRYGERSFLLTGDIEQKIEDRLIASKVDIKADVLKVGHHGSRTSTSPEFLSRVQPVWALISVAAHSPFGHPHPQTIQCLVEHRVPIFRTDRGWCHHADNRWKKSRDLPLCGEIGFPEAILQFQYSGSLPSLYLLRKFPLTR